MASSTISRRTVLRTALMTLGVYGLASRARSAGAGSDLAVPNDVPQETFDFEVTGLESWTTVAGQWTVEEMVDAPSGRRVLMQRATRNEFNVIVAPPGPYADVDVSMRFKPMSGREDASGGIVFRFMGGRYYVVRANALEDNIRLYSYDRQRRQTASVRVKAPALGQWHTLRLVALGDRVQAWLDGTRYLDERNPRFKVGKVGLWTKADSITAFDDLVIRGQTVNRSRSGVSPAGSRRFLSRR